MGIPAPAGASRPGYS